jgi:hypothetical protein
VTQRIDPVGPRRDAAAVEPPVRLTPAERDQRRRERDARRRRRAEATPRRPDSEAPPGLDLRA